ncbi:MAG: rhodanese-like domain-containing protein [Acidimicrobiia bacterium]|nr:rhodanese-like domain-containing protein [Acidimicrobiia bacterium]
MPSIDALLEQARSGLQRVQPSELSERMATGAVVVDHRDSEDIAAEGELPGALIIRRAVLEWRLVADSPGRRVELEPGQQVILVCNDGYSSSLAASTLQQLGVTGATDLIGGYRAWRAFVDGMSDADPS